MGRFLISMFGGFLGRESLETTGRLTFKLMVSELSCVFEVILELPNRLPRNGAVAVYKSMSLKWLELQVIGDVFWMNTLEVT